VTIDQLIRDQVRFAPSPFSLHLRPLT
jgi:hypothetical protein